MNRAAPRKTVNSHQITTKPRLKRRPIRASALTSSTTPDQQRNTSTHHQLHHNQKAHKSTLLNLTRSFAVNPARKPRLRDEVKIPENYQPIDHQAVQLQKQRTAELKAGKVKTPTTPGDYFIYKSRFPNIPMYSFAFVAFVAASNYSMFSLWAEQKLWDLPPEALYGIGIGCLVGLAWAQVQFSQKWVKSITCRVTDAGKLPRTVKVTTGNQIGLDKVHEVPLSTFRGLSYSDKKSETNMAKPLLTIEVGMKQNYLILWKSQAHFANPSGALESILGIPNVDGLVTSRGHSSSGKLYSDVDYDAVMEKMRNAKLAETIVLPSQVEAELKKSADDGLTWEISRQLGIMTREQEMDELTKATKHYEIAADLFRQRADADLRYDTAKVARLDTDIQEVLAIASSATERASKSMLHKAQYVYNPEIDFDGFSKEAAMLLFKDVLKTQKTQRHPRTTSVRFIFGRDNRTSEQLMNLAQMYLKAHPVKHQWGEKGTPHEGRLLVLFKTRQAAPEVGLNPEEFFEEHEKKTKDYMNQHKKGTFTM